MELQLVACVGPYPTQNQLYFIVGKTGEKVTFSDQAVKVGPQKEAAIGHCFFQQRLELDLDLARLRA
jgi:hypothetical protein